MRIDIKERVLEETMHILKTKDTIRDIAKIYKVSKSTVHKDLHERLREIDGNLYFDVDRILKYHIDIRHIRGGESTKNKYLNLTK
jgi:putative DeoR family transcriptional regulator (stage III sporulation protein D)